MCETILSDEYSKVLQQIGGRIDGASIVDALTQKCDWTPNGAAVIVMLAQQYGTFVLRNALALANALGIEDGTSGM